MSSQPQKEPTSPSLEQLPKLPGDLSASVLQERPPLHHVEVKEKVVLPTKEQMEAEKAHEKFKESVENFDKPSMLRQVSTEEKVHLPTQEEIVHEKLVDVSEAAAHFDKAGLKHVEPVVKTTIEVIDGEMNNSRDAKNGN